MLLSFRVTNHRSLRDEQQLLLTPEGRQGEEPPAPESVEPLRVAGIFGANASGKSNIVDALRFMVLQVRGYPRRGREEEPAEGIERSPFRLDHDSPGRPSTYVVDLLDDGERHTYGFVIDDTAVVAEWLFRYTADGREEVVFERDGDELSNEPEGGLFPVSDVIEIESNVLLMEVFAKLQPKSFDSTEMRSLRAVSRWFTTGLVIRQRTFGLPRRRVEVPGHCDRITEKRLSKLLVAADTGIEDIQTESFSREMRDGREQEFVRWVFRHRASGHEHVLGLEDQSEGTQALMDLGLRAFSVLDRGRTMVVDELDASLHTHLSARLIELFRDPRTNPRGAQLIFTSHDAALLGRIRGGEVLARDQIWFSEKSPEGATELYPLSGYEVADEGARARKYLAGRYGAVPFVDDDLFSAALAAREDPIPDDSSAPYRRKAPGRSKGT
ncbi:ATP-binding protein [Streptomonospora halophila]|uniref:ATP-binding protein n=1 Tax=Streptomonospora halophila TaxID=427369 RepID=A0ABP9G583_9ACTN